MKNSLLKGSSFGLTSGVITTLGLMVGLHSGTGSEIAVLSGIITIAVADGLSDALGIHISEESENVHTDKQIWAATISTFMVKFFVALTFIIPVLLFSLSMAVVINLIWGYVILITLSHVIAKSQNKSSLVTIAEHVGIAVVVVAVTHYLGEWVSTFGMS